MQRIKQNTNRKVLNKSLRLLSFIFSIVLTLSFLSTKAYASETFSAYNPSTHILVHSLGGTLTIYKGTYPSTATVCASGSGFDSPVNLTFLFTSVGECMYLNVVDNMWATNGTDYTTWYAGTTAIATSSITLQIPTPQTFLGNPITIGGKYTNSDTYNQIRWYVNNLTLGQINKATSTIILQNGTFTFQKNWTLPTSGSYSAQAELYDSTTGSSTFSNYLYFGLNSATTSSQLLIDLTDSTSTGSILGFLNVPSLLSDKVPFGYMFQIISLINTTIASSATSTLPTGTISFKIPGQATTTFDMFSKNTIMVYMTQANIDLFRGLEVVILYFSFIWFIYHDIKRRKLF